MKTTFLSIILGSLAMVAHADPSPQAVAFLAVPKGQNIVPNGYSVASNIKTIPDASIPKELRAELKKFEFGPPPYGVAPDTYKGFTHDLNSDGIQEYFIYSPDSSGSGGRAFVIYALVDSSWKRIYDFQGALYKMPNKGGWPLLINTGRGGGENYTKIHLKFENGRYVQTLIERYDNGKIGKEAPAKKD